MLHLFLAFISIDTDSFTLENGVKVNSKGPKTFEDCGEQWYFVHHHTPIELLALNETKLELKQSHVLRPGWFYSFLDSETRDRLMSNLGAELVPVEPMHKLPSKRSAEGYLVLATSTFSYGTRVSEEMFLVKNMKVEELAKNKLVRSIYPIPKWNLLNRWTTGYLQSGSDSVFNSDLGPTSNRSVNNAGYKGKGSVVTIIDSGLDSDHCFFRDSNRPMPFNTVDHSHRKVVSYIGLVDISDKKQGHGTHVAGTIAGYPEDETNSLSLYAGAAPEAKIYMVDVGKDGSGSRDISFSISDLPEVIVNATNLGSHIISCSFGTEVPSPTMRYVLDYYGYLAQQTLFVFAAGNIGRDYSIYSPGDSKNVLTVGALTKTSSAHLETQNMRIAQVRINGKTYSIDADALWDMSMSGIVRNMQKMPIVLFESIGDSDLADKAVVLRSNSNIEANLAILAQKGCKVVLAPFSAKRPQQFVFSLSSSALNSISDGETASFIMSSKKAQGEEDTASFSSRGSTQLGLQKPDVMAPGETIVSSKCGSSSESCDPSNLVSISGTSMATPSVSGHLALIEEFLKSDQNRVNSPNVSSTLLKAMAIQSARPLKKQTRVPDSHRGYGVLELSRILHVSDTYGIRYTTDIIGTSSRMESEITVTKNGGDLIVTLVWADIPTSVEEVRPLVVDLDLSLVSPSGKIYLGNQNGGNMEDGFSTSEKIDIPASEVETGTYKVVIISNNFFTIDIVPFSVVLSGPFDNSDTNNALTFERVYQCDTCGTGRCEATGKCICDDSHIGNRCQVKIEDIKPRQAASFTIQPRETKTMRLKLPNDQSKYVIFSFKHDGGKNGLLRVVLNNHTINKPTYPSLIYMTLVQAKSAARLEKRQIEGESLYVTILSDIPTPCKVTFDYSTTDNSDEIAIPIGLVIFVLFVVALSTGLVVHFCSKRAKNTQNTESVLEHLNTEEP